MVSVVGVIPGKSYVQISVKLLIAQKVEERPSLSHILKCAKREVCCSCNEAATPNASPALLGNTLDF
jgi:hypothetical protein